MVRCQFLAGILILLPSCLYADAIMKSTAMFATTIAEYYVEQDHVRLELEIGEQDIGSFRNLLPDEFYQELGYGDAPLKERLDVLVKNDLAILLNGEALPGFVQKIGPAVRLRRDEVTGEELPTGEDKSTVVIGATLIYPFEGTPGALTLMAPSVTGAASIGFVLYHLGVAVNDFRYLSSGYEVMLDWEDPWYSAFSLRALQRQYYSSMTGFIYVEPFEVRKEIVVRPYDLRQWIDLELDGQETIAAERQEEIKRKVAEFMEPHFKVKIDGVPVSGTLDRINFLRRTLKSSTVVDGQDIPLLPATMGLIYVYPISELPQTVEMEWDLFSDKMQKVPSASVDQAGALPIFLDPDDNVLVWQNFLKFPEIPTMVEVRPPPGPLQKAASWGRWLVLALGLMGLYLLIRSRKSGNGHAGLAVTLLTVGVLGSTYLFHLSRQADMDQEQRRELVRSLLHNVYRAFDYRGEEVIYDALARSVSGDLLTEVYLETRRGLELANQGGAQVKVKSVEVMESEFVDSGGDQLLIDARWSVFGSVGHWGHVHQRTNGYHALLKITDADGSWKISDLDILQEERL